MIGEGKKKRAKKKPKTKTKPTKRFLTLSFDGSEWKLARNEGWKIVNKNNFN